jgi:hypothetical protein
VFEPFPAASPSELARTFTVQQSPSEANIMPDIKAGRYRHYKGNEYSVLGVARHSETQEELVVYRQQYGDYGLWVRPLQMFAETVLVDGQKMSRFRFLGEEPVS